MSDRHDELLDDAAVAGFEYLPDDELLGAIRAAGFRITLPADDDGDGYHYLVTRDAPPLVFSLPPMAVRGWWWGWIMALTGRTSRRRGGDRGSLPAERDELRRHGGPRTERRTRRRRGLRW